MKRKSFSARLLIGLFCGYIGAFALLYVLLPGRDYSEKEKRVLAQMTELTGETLIDGSFESGFENWLSDHVPARDALVGVHAVYELASGRNGLSGVILAGNQRLLAAPEALDAADIEKKCGYINRLAANSQVPVTVMIIPTNGYMHQGDMPSLHAQYHDGEAADIVAASLDADIGFIWPEAAFQAFSEGELYYRTDHHLTSLGCYEAFRLYAASLGFVAPEREDYAVSTHGGFYGSMYNKAGLWWISPDDVEIWRSRVLGPVSVSFDDRDASSDLFFEEHLAEMDKYPVFLDGNHGLVTIDTQQSGERLLIVRDSFGHCFAPFAADGFSKVILADLRYYRKPLSELVKEEEIDRVLVLYGMDTFMTDTNFSWMR